MRNVPKAKAFRIGEGGKQCARLARLVLVVGLSSGFGAHGAETTNSVPDAVLTSRAAAGYRLFDHNCAHCHGDDARGDEGPDLHDLHKSDEKLQKIIKGGIKGEMPSFGKKFSDADVEALIAYLRTLK